MSKNNYVSFYCAKWLAIASAASDSDSRILIYITRMLRCLETLQATETRKRRRACVNWWRKLNAIQLKLTRSLRKSVHEKTSMPILRGLPSSFATSNSNSNSNSCFGFRFVRLRVLTGCVCASQSNRSHQCVLHLDRRRNKRAHEKMHWICM